MTPPNVIFCTDETNLKKQGMLPLTFSDPADYDKVQPEDKVDLVGIKELAPESKVKLIAKHKDGSKDEIELSHSCVFSLILSRGSRFD